MSKSERTQVLLTPEQRDRVERAAIARGSSVGAVIRDAVDAFVGPSPDQRRQALAELAAMNEPVEDWPTMKEQIVRAALK